MTMRHALRTLAYRTGALGAYHRLRNGPTLTVAMFHRVLPQRRQGGADPEYTVSAELFAQCLDFFSRHYSVVDLDTVLAARAGRHRLPKRALLITFDDGWADNVSVALPLLRDRGLPAVIFVATDAVADPSPCWWQEVLLRALRDGRASYEDLWRSVPGPGEPPPAGPERDLHLLLRFQAGGAAARAEALAPFAIDDGERHMLTMESVRRLPDAGIAVGAHGASHMPLSFLPSPLADVALARASLAEALADGSGGPQALACPHGRYTPEVVAAARAAGFRLVFTSDPWLNATTGGALAGDVLGRIDIPTHQITGTGGALDPARLATWLFTRAARPPEPAAASAAAPQPLPTYQEAS